MQRRAYQEEALREFIESPLRLWALLWERQAGKSTTFADFALYEMLRFKNRTVIYGSASLLLAQEITLKASIRASMTAQEIVEADARLLQGFAAGVQATVGDQFQFATVDASKDKEIKKLSTADFADLFQQQKLEFRVYHDRTAYSRCKVIAPNIATARSWSGTVLLDEIAFIRNLRELITALIPIVSTNRDYKLILSTTPPEFDDTHYSFELLAPPPGLEFKPNPTGNWYESDSKIRVHRADAFDTNLAGKKIFDLKTGDEITPAQAFERAPNKDGHRIAHWLWWMLGGAAACDLLRLKTAQERGASQCQNFLIDTDADMVAALNWLHAHIDPKRRVGIGFDVATTTKGKSNPSVVSVAEENGPEWLIRFRAVWKTKDPDIANERLDGIIDTIANRGSLAKALAQDATNEKYYAEDNRKRLRRKLPVILIVASETVEKPGLEKPTNWKEYLGDQLVAKLDDNNLTLPGDTYTRMDYRLVMKDRGKFVCEPNAQGMHGDTFDADKLAGHALTGNSGRTIVPDPNLKSEISDLKSQMWPKWPPYACDPPMNQSISSL
ncbi:MAG: hypothetical protein ABSE16_14695 [Verrucomicrobiota bacterium]|jgi:hypothetical protein